MTDSLNVRVVSKMADRQRQESYLIAAVFGFFLLSGFSSLIYQVIWTRLLVFVFGSTTFATSTVLAVFMGGLAMGSFLAGRYSDRSKNPFLVYGVLEGLIGVFGILAPLLFSAAIPVYRTFFQMLHAQVIVFGLLRFLVAACILLVPTSCMGATLPFLARFVTDNLDCVAARVGSLYAVNTLGAVLGAITAGFFLIPALGISCTTYVAAAINIALAAGVAVLSRLLKTGSDVRPDTSEALLQPAGGGMLPLSVRAVMLVFALSGGLAMIYEVAWTRSLLMVIGSTTYAFTVMLSTFLIGIFLGSLACARVADRLKNPVLAFACAELCVCFAGYFALVLFSWLPAINLELATRLGAGPALSMLARFISAGCIMVPISLCLGAIFPLAVKICTPDLQKLGASIGNLYAVNTAGAIAGAFAAGFLIIPMLGSEQTLAFTSLSNLVLGLSLLILFGALSRFVKTLALIGTILTVIYLASHPLHVWDVLSILYSQSDRRQVLSSSVSVKTRQLSDKWRPGGKPLTLDGLTSIPRLVFCKEGPCANVAVTIVEPPATGKVTTLFTNGHADASDYTDMDNQAMLAAFPLLVKPQSDDVCVVGWGSGVTSGYALRFPIKKLVCAEIEPVVLETSPFFHKVNYEAEMDRRSRIEPADGRNLLLGTAEKFDVIISEPSNPWQAGVCNLFTREYFDICSRSLKDDGAFAMWSQVTEIPTENLVQVYAALRKVFPEVFILDSGTGDTIAIACKQHCRLSLEKLQKALELPGLRKTLSRFALTSPEDFLCRIRVCPSGLDRAVLGSSLNTDDMNYLEYAVSSSYESKVYVDENDEWFLKNAGEIWNYIDWGARSNTEKAAEMVKVARRCVARSPLRALLWLAEAKRIHLDADALSLESEIKIRLHDLSGAARSLRQGAELFPGDARFVGLSGVMALQRGDYKNARQLLAEALKIDNTNCTFAYYLALAYSSLDLLETDGLYQPPPSGDYRQVVDLCKKAAGSERFVCERPQVLLLLADAYKSLERYSDALLVLDRYLKKVPEGIRGWQLLAETFGARQDWQKSAYCWNRAAALAAAEKPALLAGARRDRLNHNDTQSLRQIQLLLQRSPADEQALAFLKDYAEHNRQAAAIYASCKADSQVPGLQ